MDKFGQVCHGFLQLNDKMQPGVSLLIEQGRFVRVHRIQIKVRLKCEVHHISAIPRTKSPYHPQGPCAELLSPLPPPLPLPMHRGPGSFIKPWMPGKIYLTIMPINVVAPGLGN